MTNIGAPDILSFSRLSRLVSDIKSRSDTVRTESVTGQREDVTAATNGDVGSAHLLKKAVDDVKAYQGLLTLSQARAQRSQTALDALGGEAVRIGSQTLAAIGRQDTGALNAISADANAAIFNIFSVLNVTEAGRALFGGDATDRPPLANPEQLLSDIATIMSNAANAADAEAQLDIYFNDPAGGYATSIYQGGANDAPAVEIAPGVRIDVSASANDQPIKDLIRGLAVVAGQSVATFADRDVFLESGAGGALAAEAAVTELRAAIGVGEARIDAAISRYEAEETVLSSLLNRKIGRDPFEAASELQLLETQLEASYLLTARLARLTIADYIR